jgi:hypothetical protein
MWRHPRLLVYPTLDFLMLLLLEGVFYILFYWVFNIHIFDESTLERWGLVSIWQFGFFALLTIGPLYYISAISAQITKLSIIKSIHQIINAQPYSILKNFKQSIKEVGELMKFAALTTFVTLLLDPGMHRYIKKMIFKLGGQSIISKVNTNLFTWKERIFLVLPLIGFKKITTKSAVIESCKLMAKKFGTIPVANFNFVYLMWIGTLTLGIFIERIITLMHYQALGVAAFIAVLCFVMVFVRAGEAIFQTATYLYCTDKETGIFTQADFDKNFSVDTTLDQNC